MCQARPPDLAVSSPSAGQGTDRLADARRSAAAVATRRRGIVLITGGVALALLVRPVGPLVQSWIPLLVGLTFVAAGGLTGPRSPLWGPGLVVSAYGTAEVVNSSTDVPGSGAWTLVAIGLGGLLAAYLGSRGWAMGAASVASPVVFIGIGQWIAGNAPDGTVTWFSAAVTVLYGVAELVVSRSAAQPVSAS
jgi:hypothetical protein